MAGARRRPRLRTLGGVFGASVPAWSSITNWATSWPSRTGTNTNLPVRSKAIWCAPAANTLVSVGRSELPGAATGADGQHRDAPEATCAVSAHRPDGMHRHVGRARGGALSGGGHLVDALERSRLGVHGERDHMPGRLALRGEQELPVGAGRQVRRPPGHGDPAALGQRAGGGVERVHADLGLPAEIDKPRAAAGWVADGLSAVVSVARRVAAAPPRQRA